MPPVRWGTCECVFIAPECRQNQICKVCAIMYNKGQRIGPFESKVLKARQRRWAKKM